MTWFDLSETISMWEKKKTVVLGREEAQDDL